MSRIAQVYEASTPLMQHLTEEHQHVVDFCHAVRFILNASPSPENQLFIRGLEQVMTHVEGLRRVASSYHQAVGEQVRAELRTQEQAQTQAREQPPESGKSV